MEELHHLNEATAIRDYLWHETEGAVAVPGEGTEEAIEILTDQFDRLVRTQEDAIEVVKGMTRIKELRERPTVGAV
ncbi:MAG: hypothetical protein ACE5LS_08375 [Thermoplasmata archaeon]